MADPEVILPTHDEIASDFRDAWEARGAEASPPRVINTSEGSLPYKLSKAAADITMPLYANHNAILQSFRVRGMTGTRLEEYAREKLEENDDGSIRLPATGGSGYFEADKIASGGTFILAGTVILHRATNTRYEVTTEATYLDGEAIPIRGISTGPATNLDADTVMVFDSPPAGCSQGGKVLAQNDGTGALVGLTGGREAETDEELQQRVIDAQRNPEAAGNCAEVVAQAQKTGGVPVQKAYAIPAWFGPGSISVPFLLRPNASASRIPNNTHRAAVTAQLRTKFPTDYSITVPFILPESVSIAVGITWISTARGFTDINPWPKYVAGGPVVVDGIPTSTALRATAGATTDAPLVGQTIALFDKSANKFRRKRIKTVTEVVAGLSWDLEFDTSLSISEVFTPLAGALISPYSLSLQRLVPQMITYMRTLGPGEMFASLPDPGGRQRRWPFSPDEWPSVITNEGIVNASKASGAVSDTEVFLPTVPYATSVGTPGVSVYLLQLADFGVYPQT